MYDTSMYYVLVEQSEEDLNDDHQNLDSCGLCRLCRHAPKEKEKRSDETIEYDYRETTTHWGGIDLVQEFIF